MIQKTMIIGPKPPAIGGIASITSILFEEYKGNNNISFLDSQKPKNFFGRKLHPLILILKIIKFCFVTRNAQVLMFSSAYNSFWEKCFWVQIARVFSVQSIIVMVDGNYPKFYSSLSHSKKKLANYLLKESTVGVQSPNWLTYYKSIFPEVLIKQISAGVDTDFFSPVHDTSKNLLSESTLKLLYVGWMLEDKGIYDLLEAVKVLAHENTTLTFTLDLVGPIYCNEKELFSIITNSGLSDIVSVKGAVANREELRDIYLRADIFVFPSHFEGFPVAVLEAVSCGLPCVGTNINGVADILDDGNNGLLVPIKSPDMLAEALKKMMFSEKIRDNFSLKSRSRALNFYTLHSCLNSFKLLIEGTDKP